MISGGKGLLSSAIIACMRFWQIAMRPVMGLNCRFHPSCSCYGVEAVRMHGPFRGLWLTFRRIVRCNPWTAGGYDPVPPPAQARDSVKIRT
ncbi:membrane protein insertion efficiency factor YidD [Acetobacter sp.]|uniref:membrane protein insertion efficiency factor YidD n=1 Tax=Acetobacter sp. TaxID=440 RepID=UPI0025C482BF|nr:membrane protein insertion efficiency factor YidD [Acetobacter sp.]MCH4092252.1 membrane protein insertion efficiency factor YidD [Acetobacter sp.]MCI1299831.1 membrane protein insertion efficiency factor YidD [Acetobacter sp.]MCI1315849.1 membrane protein insertion efficiency factor YidD [Acetobacter sp.]